MKKIKKGALRKKRRDYIGKMLKMTPAQRDAEVERVLDRIEDMLEGRASRRKPVRGGR